MKEVMIIFAVLLATLTLISAFGGGIRQKEFFYYEEGATADMPQLTEEERRALTAMLAEQQPAAGQSANVSSAPPATSAAAAVPVPAAMTGGSMPELSAADVSFPAPNMSLSPLPAGQQQAGGAESFVDGQMIEPFQGCMYAGCMV